MQAIYTTKRRKGSIIQIHGVSYAVTYTRRIPLSAPLYPSQTTEFPKVKFCTAAPGHPCVCTAGSIARIRSECLTCGSVSDLDRRLMAYEIMAHPDVIL